MGVYIHYCSKARVSVRRHEVVDRREEIAHSNLYKHHIRGIKKFLCS